MSERISKNSNIFFFRLSLKLVEISEISSVLSELAPSKWVKNLKAFQSSPHISVGVKSALKMKLSC